MKLDTTKWKAVYNKAYEDGKDKGWKASSGETCALAVARYFRDALMEEAKAKPLSPEAIKASFSEFIKTLGDVELKGFASNASAAMAFAGLKVEATAVGKLLTD